MHMQMNDDHATRRTVQLDKAAAGLAVGHGHGIFLRGNKRGTGRQ